MSESQAKFVWYDLMTSDTEAAASFYKSVLGWKSTQSGVPGHDYTTFSLDSTNATMVSGLMALPAPELRPAWMGYIGVDDVDAYTDRVVAAGGAVHVPPRDIPQIGRFSLVADPQGAVFYLFSPNGIPPEGSDAPGTQGLICWRELVAVELGSAYEFYARIFGWTKAESHDMGPLGIYQTFSTGGAPAGGMMNMPPGVPTPFWLYYFSVDAVDAAVARATASGATVAHGPAPVPGGWIAQCVDPQGALFGLASMQS